MCGRYTLAADTDELIEVFDPAHVAFDRWEPRYNLAPTQDAPVVILGNENERRLGLMRWGLVPAWADDLSIGNRLINARSETAASKPAFRDAFAERRCLVPADGFYEWRRLDDASGSRKIPYWIHQPDRRPFAFAGLWERWRPRQGGDPVVTFTLLTTRPSRWMSRLHDRMPVILPDDEACRSWLRPDAGLEELGDLLRPAPEDLLEAWPVATTVNRPANEGPELIEPVDGPPV